VLKRGYAGAHSTTGYGVLTRNLEIEYPKSHPGFLSANDLLHVFIGVDPVVTYSMTKWCTQNNDTAIVVPTDNYFRTTSPESTCIKIDS
jgi:hypothetical protein